MGLLIALVIVELIIIFLLLTKKPRTITIMQDPDKQEQLKYQEILAQKTRELDRQLSEEKRKSADTVHAAELESLGRIAGREQALAAQIRERENNLSNELRTKETDLNKHYEEMELRLNKRHVELMDRKNFETEEEIQKLRTKLLIEKVAATQGSEEYQIAIEI
jgi:hypothetical protein